MVTKNPPKQVKVMLGQYHLANSDQARASTWPVAFAFSEYLEKALHMPRVAVIAHPGGKDASADEIACQIEGDICIYKMTSNGVTFQEQWLKAKTPRDFKEITPCQVTLTYVAVYSGRTRYNL